MFPHLEDKKGQEFLQDYCWSLPWPHILYMIIAKFPFLLHSSKIGRFIIKGKIILIENFKTINCSKALNFYLVIQNTIDLGT